MTDSKDEATGIPEQAGGTAWQRAFFESLLPLSEEEAAEILTTRERELGPDHPSTIQARHKLAEAHSWALDFDRAIAAYEAVVADRERVLGPDHQRTLIARANLANAHLSADRLDQAIPLYEAAIADCRRVLGPDHPETLLTSDKLADTYMKTGQFDEAIRLFETILAGWEACGTGSNDECRNNLASAYASAGRFDQAIPLFEATLTDTVQALGDRHPLTQSIRDNLRKARNWMAAS